MELPISCKEVITSIDRFDASHCGKEEVWTGTQQKWWYEVAKGFGLLDGGSLPSLPTEKTRTKRGIATGHLEGIQRKKQARKKSGMEKSS